MTSLLRMSARLGALLIAIAASKAALAETAVPFEQVFNLGNDQGIRIELDPSDDVLVFNGGTYILWGRNLEIYAGRIQVNADTIIQAFPRGTVADLSSDGAPGAAGANGGSRRARLSRHRGRHRSHPRHLDRRIGSPDHPQ